MSDKPSVSKTEADNLPTPKEAAESVVIKPADISPSTIVKNHPHPAEQPDSKEQNFFADFQDRSSGKKYRYILFAIFAFILIITAFLLKPQIEAFFKPQPNLESYLPVSQEPKSMHLVINNPDDELLTFDKTINISGKTSPKSSVVISNGDLNWGISTLEDGQFSKVIDLKPGINNVGIYAFDPQGNNKIETRTIYYSEEKL